ncbi:MAG: 1-deoxy-D-xylulose-5-phosphate synthase [Candidatus Auribacter fodinae]|jgi:transketolase|uniref:1-deoxy-D-xylulose-5-phosphate synthase n=1 Tax=Candidatus Auribacter fodinae TaxID=2093366 RepID=A0A3A4R152_9BACT|nr:MAG: 1-deoxy-D-xylulose-5-phosphate synthase [Candidatus Auribacter fodinae]
MLQISFIPEKEIHRILSAQLSEDVTLRIISAICRVNAFSAVKLAGSGHLGSSFSAMDLFTYLYFHELNVRTVGVEHPDRDIFFSSKGHDCPGQYSVLVAAGIIPYSKLLKLRRFGGLDGHPDVKIPGMEINSGSLGMGISKAKGMAIAKKLSGSSGKIIVMTGDGELQEGQIWESLQTTAHQKVSNIIVLVDRNRIQTDKRVSEIIEIDSLERKFEAFGWHAQTCDGHDFSAIRKAFETAHAVADRPKAIIAETIKGCGISFMEGERALRDSGGLYRWHAGAPDDDSYENGFTELLNTLNSMLKENGIVPVTCAVEKTQEKNRQQLKNVAEKVVAAYGDALVELGAERSDIVVLDADLSADCGVRGFEKAYPCRFIENGIAEQDMVSTAGGLALHGYLPVVNSFGVFLSSRANEQIYANASENTKIIYACHYAGLIPAGPGKSHQSLRDISLFGALPNCIIAEPCNAVETRELVRWCVNKADSTCMIRLVISPSPRTIDLPENYVFEYGKGTVLADGADAAVIAYGPVMLNEALTAQELLAKQGINIKVINMPWLNRIDTDWLVSALGAVRQVFVMDNHFSYGGLGDLILKTVALTPELRSVTVTKCAVDTYPACGTPAEALAHHHLDGKSIASKVLNVVTPV